MAELYGVSTKVLNQAVKRNSDRFPNDFVFRLTKQEKLEVVTNCDHLRNLKFSPAQPFAFTEQGVAMLSSVLRRMKRLTKTLQEQQGEAEKLDAAIAANLNELGYGG